MEISSHILDGDVSAVHTNMQDLLWHLLPFPAQCYCYWHQCHLHLERQLGWIIWRYLSIYSNSRFTDPLFLPFFCKNYLSCASHNWLVTWHHYLVTSNSHVCLSSINPTVSFSSLFNNHYATLYPPPKSVTLMELLFGTCFPCNHKLLIDQEYHMPLPFRKT